MKSSAHKCRRSVPTALLALSVTVMTLIVPAKPPHAQAEPLTTLQVNAFSGASNLPVWVAQHEGMFARHGIAVMLSSPRGSVDQFKGLLEGRYPVVVTAFDNVVAYHSGRGAAEIGTIADLVAVMGIDRGLLTLVASPGITKIADLKGHTLAVDALSTGFSFALKDILLKAGVNGNEVSFITAGNTAGRWQAMQEKRAAAALLTLPVDLEAVDHGGIALTTVASSFGDYLGNVVALRQGWAAAHGTELNAFVSGVRDAMAWLGVREHGARAIEILHAEMPALDADKLQRVYDALMQPDQGLIRSGAISAAGARTVLSLHAKYADSTQGLLSPETYYDTRYLDAVLAPR